MPRPRIAAYYLFLQNCVEEQRLATGVYMPPNRLGVYADSRWAQLDADEKQSWKDLAEKKNAEQRQLPLILRQKPVKSVPYELKSRSQQLVHKAEEFLNICGRERLSLMSRDFVCCSIIPFFVNDFQNTPIYYPGEICLVRWNIAQGVKELYHVYVDAGVTNEARHVSPREWKEWSHEVACTDLTAIAKEIVCFIGRAGGVLVQSSQKEKIDSCLDFFFSGINRKIETFEQTLILHGLMSRDTNFKQLAIADVRANFYAATRMTSVRMDVEGFHTGVRCSWHENKSPCAARRALADAFLLSQQLGQTFVANCLPGKHWPIARKLVPKARHICSQRFQVADLNI